MAADHRGATPAADGHTPPSIAHQLARFALAALAPRARLKQRWSPRLDLQEARWVRS